MEQVFDLLEEGGSGAYDDGALASYDRGIWGQVYGAYGTLSSTDETAGLDSAMGGLAVGIDGTLGGWRLGLMVYGGLTNADAADDDTSIDSTDYGLGAYGGRQWGNTKLSFAALYTEHDISSTRDVAFGDFADSLTADYGAGTAQASGQLAHELDLGSVSLTPYAGLAYVSHATDGFEEEGGPAALTSDDDVASAAFTTIGLGIDRQFIVVGDMLLTVRGAIGWRHAFADQPEATHALVGGTDFSVVGAEIADDTATLSAGLNLDLSPRMMLDITYDGQIGDGTQTHAVNGTWAAAF